MAKKRTLQAGVGAKASVWTKAIHPKVQQTDDDPQHRSTVTLVGREEKLVNRKNQIWYTFTIDGGVDGKIY